MGKVASLRAFYEVQRLTHSGAIPLAQNYDYFAWNKPDVPKETLVDQILELSTRPIIGTSLGEIKFLYNIIGLSFVDLLMLDLPTLKKIEDAMRKLEKMFHVKPGKPPTGD